jgi:uroporphyrinogen-III synthase
MHILITRPEADAAPLAAMLQKLGHRVSVEPLLKVIYHDRPHVDLGGVQALLFTSANGLRAFARLDARRDIAAFAVGDATARACREAGFQQIFTAGGDVNQLGRLISEKLKPEGGRLIHIAGSAVAGDLQGDLASLGFDVAREIFYETVTATELSSATLEKIAQGQIDLILFYSPRTAATFADLISRHQAEPYLGKIIAACLSNSVKDVLHLLPWQRIVAAKHPTQQDLLAAVGIKILN